MHIFCIGNGESRKDIDLARLKKYGPIIGCNALYRDFIPDLLISVNASMIKEIKDSGFGNQFAHMENIVDSKGKLKKVIIIDNYRMDGIGHISNYPAFFGEVSGWSSGSLSVLVSLRIYLDVKRVFLIGHDFFSDTKKINNLYKDTENYLGKNAQAVNGINWINELKQIFLDNPNINFFRVGRETDIIEEWKEVNNVKLISLNEMYKTISTII